MSLHADIKKLYETALAQHQQSTSQIQLQTHDSLLAGFKTEISIRETSKTLEDLLQSLNESENADEEILLLKILDFFEKRDKEISLTAFGYTAQPNNIANTLCKRISEKIYETLKLKSKNPTEEYPEFRKNRDLFHILMPDTAKRVTGFYSPIDSSVGENAEDALYKYGEFLLSDAVLSGKAGMIISPKFIVELSKITCLYAHMLHSSGYANIAQKNAQNQHISRSIIKGPQSLLSTFEKQRLHQYDKSIEVLFKDLNDVLFSSIENQTPMLQLKFLKDSLRAGGASGGQGGSEYNASSAAMEALPFFFEYWNRLPTDFREELEKCTFRGYAPKTLGQVLQILRDPMQVWADTTCVEVNANRLEDILNNQDNKARLETSPAQKGGGCVLHILPAFPADFGTLPRNCYFLLKPKDLEAVNKFQSLSLSGREVQDSLAEITLSAGKDTGQIITLYYVDVEGRHKKIKIYNSDKFYFELDKILEKNEFLEEINLSDTQAYQLITANSGHTIKKELPKSHVVATQITTGIDHLEDFPQQLFSQMCHPLTDIRLCIQLIENTKNLESKSESLKILLTRFTELFIASPNAEKSKLLFNCLYQVSITRRRLIYDCIKQDLLNFRIPDEDLLKIIRLLAPQDVQDLYERLPLVIQSAEELEKILGKVSIASQAAAICQALYNKQYLQQIITRPSHFVQILESMNVDTRAACYKILLACIPNSVFNTPTTLVTVLNLLSMKQCNYVPLIAKMREIMTNESNFILVMSRIADEETKVLIFEVLKQKLYAMIQNSKNPIASYIQISEYLAPRERGVLYNVLMPQTFIRNTPNVSPANFHDLMALLKPEQRNEVFDEFKKRDDLRSMLITSENVYLILRFLTQEQRTELYLQYSMAFKKIINETQDFSARSTMLALFTGPEQIALCCDIKLTSSMEFRELCKQMENADSIYILFCEQLPRLIKTAEDFENICIHLNQEQRTEVYLRLKNKEKIKLCLNAKDRKVVTSYLVKSHVDHVESLLQFWVEQYFVKFYKVLGGHEFVEYNYFRDAHYTDKIHMIVEELNSGRATEVFKKAYQLALGPHDLTSEDLAIEIDNYRLENSGKNFPIQPSYRRAISEENKQARLRDITFALLQGVQEIDGGLYASGSKDRVAGISMQLN